MSKEVTRFDSAVLADDVPSIKVNVFAMLQIMTTEYVLISKAPILVFMPA